MKMILTLCLLAAAALPSFAAGESLIVTSDGKRINTSSITAKPNGDLEYVSPDSSSLRVRIAKGRYRYAWVPKPADVTEADAKYKSGDYKAAAELYLKAYLNYRNLGWDVYCMMMEADTLDKLGMRLLAKVSRSRNDELASSAFMKRAEILAGRGNRKDAANLYFQVALLFPKSAKHPEALYRTYENLKALKDARADKFAARLKAEYPNDSFAKRLK